MSILDTEVGVIINDLDNAPATWYNRNCVNLNEIRDKFYNLPRFTKKNVKSVFNEITESLLDSSMMVFNVSKATELDYFIMGYIAAYWYSTKNRKTYPIIKIAGTNHFTMQDGPARRSPNYHIVQWQSETNNWRSIGHIRSIMLDVEAMKQLKEKYNEPDIMWMVTKDFEYYFVGFYFYLYGYSYYVSFDPVKHDDIIDKVCSAYEKKDIIQPSPYR